MLGQPRKGSAVLHISFLWNHWVTNLRSSSFRIWKYQQDIIFLYKSNPKWHMWNITEVTFSHDSFGTPHILFVQPLFPHRRAAFLGMSIVHFSHSPWCHLKRNITVFLRKPFPSFVMNSDFITFDLKMGFLLSNLLITTISKFKEIFSGGSQLGFY